MRENLIKNAVRAESNLKDYMQRSRMAAESKLNAQLNDLLYETAKEYGISLYQLCASVVPEFSSDIKQNPYENGSVRFDLETTITLKPIE